jgi:peptidoglycan hydrolase-like protein with peptidoglycan-binding domain
VVAGDPRDGCFVPVTEAHVRAYQKMRGVAVDGVVGPVTWHEMLGH